MGPTVIHGDCLNVMAAMPDNSVDAIITDPPYGLSNSSSQDVVDVLTRWLAGERNYLPSGRGFMGREWDAFVPAPAVWDQALRVLKPGGYAAVFAGDRTQDLMGMSMRLAGFEIRQPMAWIFGSGMPKSRTSLKPAIEPILLARKPFRGSERETTVQWGTGLKVDAARIPHRNEADLAESVTKNAHAKFGSAPEQNKVYNDRSMLAPRDYDGSKGRWPTTVVLDEPMADLMDEQSGSSRSRKGKPRSGRAGTGWGTTKTGAEYDDIGGASRFFYVAKARNGERPSYIDSDGELVTHVSVKPMALIDHLMALLVRPGDVVLDPYAGTGTTGAVGQLRGVHTILIEREAKHLPLIAQRVESARASA